MTARISIVLAALALFACGSPDSTPSEPPPVAHPPVDLVVDGVSIHDEAGMSDSPDFPARMSKVLAAASAHVGKATAEIDGWTVNLRNTYNVDCLGGTRPDITFLGCAYPASRTIELAAGAPLQIETSIMAHEWVHAALTHVEEFEVNLCHRDTLWKNFSDVATALGVDGSWRWETNPTC